MLKSIHAQENRGTADRNTRALIEALWDSKMSKAADLGEQSVHKTLTYYAFLAIHLQKIRTNDPLERIMKEIRGRSRVVGELPDGQSCLNLAASRLRYIAGTTWSTKRYIGRFSAANHANLDRHQPHKAHRRRTRLTLTAWPSLRRYPDICCTSANGVHRNCLAVSPEGAVNLCLARPFVGKR